MAIRGFGNQNNLHMRLGLNSTMKTNRGEEQSQAPAESKQPKPEEAEGNRVPLKPIEINFDNVNSLLIGKGVILNNSNKVLNPNGDKPTVKPQSVYVYDNYDDLMNGLSKLKPGDVGYVRLNTVFDSTFIYRIGDDGTPEAISWAELQKEIQKQGQVLPG